MITDTQISEWLAKAQEIVDRDYDVFMPKPRHNDGPVLIIEKGKRYARIVATDDRRDQRSAWGFIDMTNGDVLKANSWKAPAKNFARGNLADDNGGLARIKWTGIA